MFVIYTMHVTSHQIWVSPRNARFNTKNVLQSVISKYGLDPLITGLLLLVKQLRSETD